MTWRQVEKEKVMACMTCPLCNFLFAEATTISECLHTFCRNCIYEKITEEELDCCPVCNINLGCVALEKLRADHNMEDLREKIFPGKRKKVKAPEAETVRSVPLPAKRKERSLSSLVNTAAHSGIRTPPESLILVQNKNNANLIEREIDISNQTITQIVEETRSNHCSIQDTAAKSNPVHNNNMPELERIENGLPDVCSGRRSAGTNESYAQPNCDADANSRCRTTSNPIWFSLVASDSQEGAEPLPQISSSYLRVRDGSLPVSFIQKYLMKKLGLASETEVEISLKGKPVSSMTRLQDVIDLWLPTITKVERIQASVGSSAKDFVMVLSYGRKPHHHEHVTNVFTKYQLVEQCPDTHTHLLTFHTCAKFTLSNFQNTIVICN